MDVLLSSVASRPASTAILDVSGVPLMDAGIADALLAVAGAVDQMFDYVVTVCDQVREQCPVFPGTPELIHWSIEDPSRVVGSEAAQMQAFEQVARQLTTRIQHLLTRATRARRGA